MSPFAKRMVRRFGKRWADIERETIARLLAEAADFVAARRSDAPPRVLRMLPRPPVQKPAPPWMHGAVLPQLPTLSDLAAWLNLDADELGWYADRWRVPAQQAGTPLHRRFITTHHTR